MSDMIGDESEGAETMRIFMDCLRLVERLHRRLLDVIRNQLEEAGRGEINAVQALLLFNIGGNEITAGELRSRGYYLGSNVSYNLKKMVDMGYVSHQKAEHDKRSVRISLTEKGSAVSTIVDKLYKAQLEEILEDEVFDNKELRHMRRNLRNLERFWADQLRFV